MKEILLILRPDIIINAINRMKHRFLLIIIVFTITFQITRLKGQFVVQYPSLAESMTACLDPSLLTVRIDVAVLTTDNNIITIQLAPGITYVPGSVTRTDGTAGITIADAGGTPESPQFLLNPGTLTVGQFIEFTILREADCLSRAHAMANGTFKDKVTVTGTGGTTTENDQLINPYNVNFPSISLIQPAAVNNTVVNGVYNRSFTITNGAVGAANAVHFYLVYPAAGIELVSLELGANLLTPIAINGDTSFFSLNGNQLGPDGLFTNGESVVLNETFRIRKCNTTTAYLAGWGCSPMPAYWCQTASGSSSISMATGVGTFSAFTSGLGNGYVDLCGTGNGGYVNMQASYTWAGIGDPTAGSAFNVILRVGGNAGSNALSGIQANIYTFLGNATINGQSVPSTYSAGFFVINLNNHFSSDPDGTGGLQDADGDGFYDDIAPGSTVQIRFQAQFNCGMACNVSILTNAGLAGDIRYNLMCGGGQVTTNKINGFSWSENSWSANGYAPVNIANNAPFRVRLSSGINSNISPFKTANTRYMWYLVLPSGLQVSGTGNPTWTNGQYYNSLNSPVAVSYSINADTLKIMSPSTLAGWAEIDLLYDCSVGGGTNSLTFNYGMIQINNINTGCVCMGKMTCATLTSNVHCPGSCGAGPVSGIPVVRRTDNCLGWTSGSMVTRQLVANIPAFELSKALYLDTIQITGSAIQSNPASSLGVRLELGQAGTVNKLQPIDLYYEIWRVGVMESSGTLTSYSLANSGGGVQRTDWDLASGLPAGSLLAGDSIFSVSRYVVATNALPTNDIQSGGTWYFYNVNGTLLEHCNEFVPEMYLVGTVSVNGRNAFNIYTCTSTALGGGTSHVARRFNNAGVKYLHEFRPGLMIDSMVAVIPQGYEYVSAGFSYTAAYNTPAFTLPLTPASINGNAFSFINPGTGTGAWLPLEITVVNTYGAILPITVRPTCAVLPQEPIEIRMYIRDYYYAYQAFPTYPPANQGNLLGFSQNIIHANKGNMELSDLTGLIQAAAPEESWEVRIENIGLGVTPYTWIAIPASATVSVLSVHDVSTNTLVTPVTYPGGIWYKLSTSGLTSGASASYRIRFNYSSCTLDSLRILAGWNCGSFPTDPTTYSCDAQELYLKYAPVPTEVELVPVAAPPNPHTLCDPLSYEYFINCSQAGNTINNNFTIRSITGILPVAGSFEAEYPRGTLNWAPVPFTVSGLNYTYDLTAHPAYPVSGLPGTINATGNDARQIGVRFLMNTSCDFTSATSFRVTTAATASCGAQAQGSGVGITAPPVYIYGAEAPYVTVYNLISSNDLVSCNTTTTLSVSSTTVAGVVGNSDFIFIDLPFGLTYIPGSFGCTSPNCPVFVSNVILPGNTERITLQVPPGIVSGTTMNYSIGVRDIPVADCDDHEVIFNAVVAVGGISCASAPGGACPSVFTSTGSDRVVVRVLKPDLRLSNFGADAVADPPSGETVTLSVKVTNQGEDMLPGQNAWVNFYLDQDYNLLYTQGPDFFMTPVAIPQLNHGQSITLQATLQVPSWRNTCSYLAVIHHSDVSHPSDCICGLQQIQAAPSPLLNAGPDQVVCGNGFVNLGSPRIHGYSYSWSPTAGLSDPHGSNPVFSSAAAGNSVLTLTTTRSAGCTSADEVTVDVRPVLGRTTIITDVTCFNAGNGTITVTVSGGTPPFSYSIDNGLTYPFSGPSPFIFSNLTPGNYQVRVKDSQGCETTLCL